MSSSAITAPLYLDPTKAADGSAAAPSFAFANSTSTGIYRVSANTLGISTAGVQRVVVDASGNVGIGTAPSAFGSYYPAIQANPPSGFVIAAKANDVEVGTNFVKDNTFTARYVTTGQGAALAAVQPSGFIWQTAASGTAGNTITWSERMRLDANGNLLVGTTADNGGRIIALGTNRDGVTAQVTNNSNSPYVGRNASNSVIFIVGGNGFIYAMNTTITSLSDLRLKENVKDLDKGLDAVMALKPRRFDWKEGKGKDIKDDMGFIAQEFEQVFPDLVTEWQDSSPENEAQYKAISPNLIPTLVKAIQEQQAQIEEMKAKLAALEAKP